MQSEMYNIIILFQFIICGFKLVYALVGNNIRVVEENEFPSVACILRYSPDISYHRKMACTGSFVSHNFILTAEHCFRQAATFQYEVSIGERLIEQGQRYYPVWWISYDQWAAKTRPRNSEPMPNDILLAKIFGVWRDITPGVILQFQTLTDLYGFDVNIAGCGRDEAGLFPQLIQTANVTIISNEVCAEVISHLRGQYLPLSDKFICTVGIPYTHLSYGDSGGPLFYQGGIVGVNNAVCPYLNNTFNPSKVNLHVNIIKYKRFLEALVIPDLLG